jgi:hypothetical protein
MTTRTRVADVLHQVGRIPEAAAAFKEAKVLQEQSQKPFPSLAEFLYCELLLGQGEIQQVMERAAKSLRSSEWPFEIALDNLSMGRARMAEAQKLGSRETVQAEEFLQRSVDTLRKAGARDRLPYGLLARAQWYRFTLNYGRAERDLGEVFRIAAGGGMGLHLADYHLESARLQLAQGNKDKSREHWTTAREMIERMGYHRRDKEVKEIEEQLL